MNKTLYFFVVTFAIGILLGIFTSFGQTFISDPFKQLANSYSIWLFSSYVAGYLLISYKSAALSGVLLQYLAILFYYIASSVRFGTTFSIESLVSINLIWLIGGTLAGPIAAVAGAIVKKKTKYLPYAVGFIAGLFISEALYQFIKLGYMSEGIVFSAIALVFLVISYYKTKYRIATTAIVTVVFTIFMYIGYAYVLGKLFS